MSTLTDSSTPGHPSSHNGQTGLGQTASVHSASAAHSTGATTSQDQGQSTQGSKDRQKSTANRRDPSSLQCFRCQGWCHMVQVCTTPAKTLNQSGGTKGMWPNLLPALATTANSRPQHSLPDPKPKLTTMKVAQRKG